jgi:dephospho-CoA kinase
MLFVGLTGGIGSGKSTAAGMLAERGAVVLDADAFAREAVARGTPGFDRVLDLFGQGIVGADGDLDRGRIASEVFADPERRRELEAIVHPEVRRRVAEAVSAHVDTSDVVILNSPLLIETGNDRDCEVVVVVSALAETQIARLVERGMDEADARARLAAQLPLERKVERADVVLDNEGTPAQLEEQVERLWSDLRARAAAAGS